MGGSTGRGAYQPITCSDKESSAYSKSVEERTGVAVSIASITQTEIPRASVPHLKNARAPSKYPGPSQLRASPENPREKCCFDTRRYRKFMTIRTCRHYLFTQFPPA